MFLICCCHLSVVRKQCCKFGFHDESQQTGEFQGYDHGDMTEMDPRVGKAGPTPVSA